MPNYIKKEEWVCTICQRSFIDERSVQAHIGETHPYNIMVLDGTLKCNPEIPGAIHSIKLRYYLDGRDTAVEVRLVNPGVDA